MVASRLPLLEGLRLTTGTVHNRVLRAASAEIAEIGPHRRQPFGRAARAGIFPPLLVYLAASGEASGKLDVMLERAADYLDREFDAFTTTALSLLEPAIIIVMGVDRRPDRAIDPAPDPATRHFGWRLLMRRSPRPILPGEGRAAGGGPVPLRAPSTPACARVPRTGSKDGFTLVELMVVLVIIGLLATIVIINVMPAADRAAVTKAQADIATLEQAIEMYRLDNQRYPTTQEGLQVLVASHYIPRAARRIPGTVPIVMRCRGRAGSRSWSRAWAPTAATAGQRQRCRHHATDPRAAERHLAALRGRRRGAARADAGRRRGPRLAVPGTEVAIHWLDLAGDLTPAQAAAAARLMLADASAEPLGRRCTSRPGGRRTG